MKRQDGKLGDEQREFLIDLYIEGLDEADDEKVADVLQFTLRDEALEFQIEEVNRFFSNEENLSEMASDALGVRQLARESFSSAFEEPYKLQILMLCDIAKQIQAKGKVAVADELANKKMLGAKIPILSFSLPEIKKAAAPLMIQASEKFWRVVQKTAILLEMKFGHEQAMQAAREKKIRGRAKKANEKKQKTRDK